MPKIANQNRAVMLAVTTALATTTLAGCTTTSAAPAATVSANQAQAALSKGKTSKAITHAEASVLAEPRNPAYRAMLGAVYMEAGRFQSAATSFKDAMSLGDTNGRTALSYSLASIAAGHQNAALSTLSEYRNDIDASDLGLALALAGNPEQGVHVLGNALRGGQATPKVRQNLAYAYALMGNWRAARLMAAEDVPADQLGNRMSEWASTAAPENYHARVASLLNVPVIGDGGQPAMLALSNHATVGQMASAAAAETSYTPGELPAQSAPRTAYSELPPLAAPAQAVNTVPVRSQPNVFADAFVAGSSARPISPVPLAKPPLAAALTVQSDAVEFVSNPQVQAANVPNVAVPKSSAVATGNSQESREVVAGEHLIQLGSFSSEAGAKRAIGIYLGRYSQLSNSEMVITKARVRGKIYYRVSAGGFQSASAKSMCSSVKTSKQGCITWAANKPLPGAMDRGVRMARR